MRIRGRWTIALGATTLVIIAAALYLILQPRMESALIVYGPRGIRGLATAMIKEFMKRYDVNVTFIHYDMGSIEIANKLISEKNNPQADVIFGLPEFYSKQVIDADVLQVFVPSNLSMIPDTERWDPTNHIMPIDKGYVLITYNETILNEKGLPIPRTLDDLLRPEYKGLVFYQDPTSSGTGLSFLVWVLSVKGTESGFSFLKSLEASIKVHPSGWTTSIVALRLGEVAIGSMFNSDVEYYEVPKLKTSATEGFVYREGIALVKGAKHPEIAKKFIEFALSTEGQNVVAPSGYMYPVNPKASSEVLDYAPIPMTKITFKSDIAGNVTEWLDRWRREIKTG